MWVGWGIVPPSLLKRKDIPIAAFVRISECIIFKMFQIIFFLGLTILVNSQDLLLAPRNNEDLSAPSPYSFSYNAPAIGGGSSHEETGDEFGRKTGSYTIQDEDGRQRIVQYVADENGFRASISTNEPGTSNQSPADVSISSSAEDEGFQQLAAPAPAVIPVDPAPARFNPPVASIPAPIPIRQIQPAAIPFQPTLIPFQPSYVPFDNRFSNQPQFIPFDGRLQQPTVFPINSNFLPFGLGNNLVLQPLQFQ